MNQELIEKLMDKNYVRAFGLMKPEEKECLKRVGKQNCICYGALTGWEQAGHGKFYRMLTYAISPDYRPEPEFVDIPIKIKDGLLGVFTKENLSLFPIPSVWNHLHLHCLTSMPRFVGFLLDGDEIYVQIESVATQINNGHKVFARFGK